MEASVSFFVFQVLNKIQYGKTQDREANAAVQEEEKQQREIR